MLKRKSLKKICLSFFCLLTLLILYLFPSKNEKQLNIDTSYFEGGIKKVVYLIDKNDYVSRVNISLKGTTVNEKILETIQYMTINGDYNDLIPTGFRCIIPQNTRVLEMDLSDDGNLKINFSKELLNVEIEDEIKLIESLVYSLTSIEKVSSVTILVDGVILNKLPKSNELLPNPIDRKYGINKEYEITNLKGASKTTLYYISKTGNNYYYVPVTKVSNDNSEKIEVIIKELTSRPIYEENLMSYLNKNTVLQNYKVLNSELNIDFNNSILSDITKNDILEEVTYAINLSIKDNYDVKTVSYTVNNKKIASFNLKSLDN